MSNQQLMVRAGWLYHVEGLTQAQIAERMLLTRRRVNELLSAALDQGIVRISFSSPLAENIELESVLRSRFSLQDAVVVPSPMDGGQMSTIIGKASAMFLEQRIQAHQPGSLGVGWGATLRETAHHLAPANKPDLVVRSMMGGLTRGSEINTFEIVRQFAKTLNAQCHYLAAPIYADDPASRDTLIAQSVFKGLLADAAAVDISFLSVGDVSNHSLQVRYGLPAATDVQELIEAGAVGDLLGRYLDDQGREVDHPLNRQVLSPELDQYRRIPCRVIASGGIHKTPILRACLANGLANVVITDAGSARALLGE